MAARDDLHDGVEDGEADDRDDGPREGGQSFEPDRFRGRGHAPPYYVLVQDFGEVVRLRPDLSPSGFVAATARPRRH